MKDITRKISLWLLIFPTALILFIPQISTAATVRLSWQPNTELDLQGYNVYFGTQPRSYGPPIPVGNVNLYEIQGLVEGETYYFAVSALDNAGNESGFSSEISKQFSTLDNIAPSVSILSPVEADTYTSLDPAVTLSGSATDDHDLQQITWQSSSGASGTASGTDSWATGAIELTEGQNVITVTAVDAAGNEGTDTLTVTYTAPDTTNPEVAITSPVSADSHSTNTATISLAGTASDNNSLQQVTWTCSTGQSGTATGTTDWTINAIALQEGVNTITVTATDASGNQATDAITISYFAVVEGLPVVSVTSSSDDGNTAANTIDNDLSTRWSAYGDGQWIQYDLGASFDLSKILIAYAWADTINVNSEFEIFVSNNASSWSSVFKGQSSGTTLQQESYQISNAVGRYVRIVGYGNLNNDWNSITEVDIFGVAATSPDETAPIVSILSPTTSGSYPTDKATLAISGSAQDDSGLTEVRWASSAGQSGTATGTTNWAINAIALQEGVNTITVTAVDAAGNEGTDTLTVTYTAPDTTNPEVAITSPVSADSHSTNTATISLAGTASDNNSLQQVTWTCSTGGNGTASGTTNWSIDGIALAEGQNIITVTAVDASGNQASDTIAVSFTAPDTQAPVITITTPTDNGTFTTNSSQASLSGTADDDQSLKQVTWSSSTGAGGIANGTLSWSIPGINLALGTNTITVTAVDSSGNKSTDVLTVIYNATDTTKPTVQITSPTTKKSYFSRTATVTIGGNASDDVGLAKVIWRNSRGESGTCVGTDNWEASGIELSRWWNTITVTAIDDAGNTSEQSLAVFLWK